MSSPDKQLLMSPSVYFPTRIRESNFMTGISAGKAEIKGVRPFSSGRFSLRGEK